MIQCRYSALGFWRHRIRPELNAVEMVATGHLHQPCQNVQRSANYVSRDYENRDGEVRTSPNANREVSVPSTHREQSSVPLVFVEVPVSVAFWLVSTPCIYCLELNILAIFKFVVLCYLSPRTFKLEIRPSKFVKWYTIGPYPFGER